MSKEPLSAEGVHDWKDWLIAIGAIVILIWLVIDYHGTLMALALAFAVAFAILVYPGSGTLKERAMLAGILFVAVFFGAKVILLFWGFTGLFSVMEAVFAWFEWAEEATFLGLDLGVWLVIGVVLLPLCLVGIAIKILAYTGRGKKYGIYRKGEEPTVKKMHFESDFERLAEELEDQLEDLKEQLDKDVVTQEQFSQKREKIREEYEKKMKLLRDSMKDSSIVSLTG